MNITTITIILTACLQSFSASRLSDLDRDMDEMMLLNDIHVDEEKEEVRDPSPFQNVVRKDSRWNKNKLLVQKKIMEEKEKEEDDKENCTPTPTSSEPSHFRWGKNKYLVQQKMIQEQKDKDMAAIDSLSQISKDIFGKKNKTTTMPKPKRAGILSSLFNRQQ